MNTDNKLHLPNMEKYLNNQDPNIEQKVKVMMDKLDKEYTDKQPQTCYVVSDNDFDELLFLEIGKPIKLKERESVYIHTPEELEALKAEWQREAAEKAVDKGIGIGRRALIGAPYYPSDEKYIKEETESYLDQHYPLTQPLNTNQ